MLFGLVSCKDEAPGSAAKVAKGPAQTKLSADGTTKLMSLITSYYGLKNALVATDAAKTEAASKQLAAGAGAMTTFLQSDTTNKISLQPYIDTVVMQSNLVTSIKDPSCEKQRLAFGTLSSAMYALLKKVDLKNGGVYKQYCPMAFNDKGAYWLSEEEEIKNPYFGKKMLECGEVQDSL